MAHFYGVCHRNCALRYVGWVLVLRKLDFRGLNGQFGIKMDNFRGLIAKIAHYRPILATKTYRYVGGVLVLRKLGSRGLKGQS